MQNVDTARGSVTSDISTPLCKGAAGSDASTTVQGACCVYAGACVCCLAVHQDMQLVLTHVGLLQEELVAKSKHAPNV